MNTDVMQSKPVLIASSIGALAGLGWAFKKKMKFWGYVGFLVAGSIAGSLAGGIIYYSTKPKNVIAPKPTDNF